MEWDILASWVVANDVYSDNNVWLIQARTASCNFPLLPSSTFPYLQASGSA